MIIKEMIHLVALFVGMLSSLIPPDLLDFTMGSIEPISTFLSYAAYFLPVGTIATMVGILIAEEMVKITLSFLRMLLHFLPGT